MRKINFYPTRGITTEQKRLWSLLGRSFPIRPATEFMPEWWQNLSKSYNVHDDHVVQERPTAKRCPGIFDFVRAGYILPMWTDLIFRWNGSNPLDGPDCLHPEIIQQLPGSINVHDSEQLMNAPFLDGGCHRLVKLNSPWYADIPEGVSLLLIQPFYHINNNFTVCPGIIDSDLNHLPNKEVNVFLKLNKPDEPIKISKGQPLMQIIPFVREDFQFSNNMPDEEKDLEFDMKTIQHLTTVVSPLEQKKLTNNRVAKNYNV